MGDFYIEEEKFTPTYGPMKAFWGSFSAPLSTLFPLHMLKIVFTNIICKQYIFPFKSSSGYDLFVITKSFEPNYSVAGLVSSSCSL